MRKSTMMKAVIAASALFASTSVFAQDKPAYETGMIPAEHIMVPDGDILASVFLISDADGWTAADEERAKALVAKGAAVVGIDFKEYLKALEADDDECIYMFSDVESLSPQIPPTAAPRSYPQPILPALAKAGPLASVMIPQRPAPPFRTPPRL